MQYHKLIFTIITIGLINTLSNQHINTLSHHNSSSFQKIGKFAELRTKY